MESSTTDYLRAVDVLRKNAVARGDDYDRLWWEIEAQTVRAGQGLTANALHKRIMRRLAKQPQR